MWERAALIGATGFVGGYLRSRIAFARTYSRANIETIAGETFDTVIVAGAPATMWIANANPAADAANLERLMAALASARAERTVLISTIAVLDSPGAGYTERTARYEESKGYGKNRRALEEHVLAGRGGHVVRLPALFGPGLRKNYIFDLLNPAPSFLAADRFAHLLSRLDTPALQVAQRAYALDPSTGMMKIDRTQLTDRDERLRLEEALVRAGASAREFTNSGSKYQLYDLERLPMDLEICVQANLAVVNMSVEPIGASLIHAHLLGAPFESAAAGLVEEDMRTEHAEVFGGAGPYISRQGDVLSRLKAFFDAARVV